VDANDSGCHRRSLASRGHPDLQTYPGQLKDRAEDPPNPDAVADHLSPSPVAPHRIDCLIDKRLAVFHFRPLNAKERKCAD
jgi:hypothetical protein